jgi:hypothetical protein
MHPDDAWWIERSDIILVVNADIDVCRSRCEAEGLIDFEKKFNTTMEFIRSHEMEMIESGKLIYVDDFGLPFNQIFSEANLAIISKVVLNDIPEYFTEQLRKCEATSCGYGVEFEFGVSRTRTVSLTVGPDHSDKTMSILKMELTQLDHDIPQKLKLEEVTKRIEESSIRDLKHFLSWAGAYDKIKPAPYMEE